MIHNGGLAPLGSMRPFFLRPLEHACIQQEVVNIALADTVQCLLGERLDALQVGQIDGQHGHGVGGPIVLQLLDGIVGRLCVSGAEDDVIWGGPL